jgi:hypothetical protein
VVGSPEFEPADGGVTGEPDVPDFEAVARRHHLLPPERWAAKRYFEHRYSTPELRRSPGTVNNGPDAIVFIGVMRGWGIAGLVLWMFGMWLVIVSDDAPFAYGVFFAGIALLVVAAIRGIPSGTAAKRYRAEQVRQSGPPPRVEPQDFEASVRRYRLLPPERWAAKRLLDHWYSPEVRRSRMMTLAKGPDDLLNAAVIRAWAIPGWILMMSGLGLLIVSGGATYAYWMGYTGMAIMAIAFARGVWLRVVMSRAEQDRLSQLPPPPR